MSHSNALKWTYLDDPNDAFWLAQVHFQTGQYSRAERLLTRPFPAKPTLVSESTSTLAMTPGFGVFPPVSSSSSVKGKGKVHTPANLHSDSSFFLSGMGGLPKATIRPPVDRFDASFDGDESLRAGLDLEANDLLDPDEKIRGGFGENTAVGNIAMMEEEGLSRLVDLSLTCRYLAARCQYQLGKWSDAMELLGKENPFRQSSEFAFSKMAAPYLDPQRRAGRIFAVRMVV
jgi:anaphase-promoting complex subunit 6